MKDKPTEPVTQRIEPPRGSLTQRANDLRQRLILSVVPALVVMALSMIPTLQFPGWQWVCALASLPVAIWGAYPFHKNAVRGLKHGSLTMDTLVSLGVGVSIIWSLWVLIFTDAGKIGMRMDMSPFAIGSHSGSHADIYFEGACMIVIFLLTGRWMEARVRYQAGNTLRSLLSSTPPEAEILLEPGSAGDVRTRVIPAAELSTGDHFLVRPGQVVPADGVIISGSSAVDTSLLTGEPLPRDVSPGDAVAGGTMNTWGSLRVQATRVGSETTLARMEHMVTEVQATRAPIQRLADRVSAVFVPVVITISLLTLIGWLATGHSIAQALTATVAVLVVACPCALGLATPTAVLVGSTRASQMGILIRSAEALEQSRTIDTMVLDKTGTITAGHPCLTSVTLIPPADPVQGQSKAVAPPSGSTLSSTLDDNQALALAAGIEIHSEHPLAQALVTAARDKNITPYPLSAFCNHAGLGVSATTERAAQGQNDLILLGKPAWLASMGIEIDEPIKDAISKAQSTGSTAVLLASIPRWDDRGATQTHGNGNSLSLDPLCVPAPSAIPVSPAMPAAADTDASVGNAPPVTIRITMSIGGMTCASCVRRVERKLEKLVGVSAHVNLATESASLITMTDYSDNQLKDVVEAAGYTGTVTDRQHAFTDSSAPAAHVDENDTPQAPASSRRDLSSLEQTPLAIAVFYLRDTVKDSSHEAIECMRDLGVEPIMLTGDHREVAQSVAQEVGISRVYSDVLPDQKRDVIKKLQNQGRVVAMVGDGVNDAAALAQASHQGLGMAMGSGTDIAIEVSDMTLMSSDLRSAATAIDLSRRTIRIIRENLIWAFAYNVAAIPLAILGLLNPMIAAAAMSASSVCVVVNALRLKRVKPASHPPM